MANFRTLVKELAEVWRIEKDKRREQKNKYRIEYAFTSGGRKYYRYADITNLPYMRGRAAMSCYNEIEMRCSRDFLLRYAEAVHNLLHQKTIDIFKINELNDMLRDRLNLTADLDLCYRMAAIVFFDSTEKPEVYEPEYAQKKIERWRKDQDVESFFLQKPLKELLPFLESRVGDFNTFTELNTEVNLLHEQIMRMVGSTSEKKPTTSGKKQ